MKRFVRLPLLLAVSACASSGQPPTSPPEPSARTAPARDDDPLTSWARSTLRSLTLEEKVGQMIFPRSDGVFVNESEPALRRLLDLAGAGRIGGVVFFQGDPLATASIANRLQEASTLPLLMASDYEWGPGMRVARASRFPRAMAFGAGGTVRDIELQAEVTAREARALGVHLLLNPVLDLNTNRDNTVIVTRSFGEDPDRAAELGATFIRRAQQLGVLTTAKHFPGHGATARDSHLELPVLRHDRARLERVELVPFRAAIEAGVAAIMPAHIAVPAIDGGRERPATLSPPLLEGLLRRELGFDGLIVSDALDMGAARGAAWDGELAVAAVAAGVDALLVPTDPLVAYHAVVRGVRRGDLSEERIDRSVLRLLSAKERLDLHRRRTVDLRDVSLRVAPPGLMERIEDIAQRSLTFVRNENDLLPLPREDPPAILLVEYLGRPTGRERDRDARSGILREELEPRTAAVRHVRVTGAAEPEEGAIDPRPGEVLLVASYATSRSLLGDGEVAASLVESLRQRAARGLPTVFASLGNPYVLMDVPNAHALIATYDASPASQRALVRALFGEAGSSGRLPVTLSAEYPLDHGIPLEARRMTLQHLDDPEEVGLSRRRLREAVHVVRKAVSDRATPGAVVLVARRGGIVLEEAIGRTSYDDDARDVTESTLYDLASLTKVIVTTTLSMILYERGRLDLDAPVSTYVPEFRGEGKDQVTVRDLLSHSGGLLWWTDLYAQFEGLPPEEAKRGYLATIYDLPLEHPPRSKMVYTDLGILLLGEILERVSGRELEGLAREEIFEPLGMDETMYRPDRAFLDRIAPTERDEWRGRVVHGEVHDENAYGLGGVAPHAGLFSTARSLARFAQMMLNGGAYGGRRLLRRDTIRLFTQRSNLVPGSSRALGWDTPSGNSSAGVYVSSASYGHTGFTGTSLWIDPERELFAILLTNRVHPTRENQRITQLRPAFHDAVMRAVQDVPIEPRDPNDGGADPSR